MRILLLLFLAGFGLAHAKSFYANDEVQLYNDFNEEIADLVARKEKVQRSSPEDFEILFGSDNDMKTELGKKLKADFEEIVEKLKDIIDNGKDYKEELVQKAKEIRGILKQLGMDISNHAKQVLKNLKRKAKDFWKKILNKIHPDDDEQAAPEDFEILYNEMKTELGKKLQANFEEIVEKIKDIIENGKAYRDDLVKKANEIRDILKEMGMDISNHAKQVLKNLKRKAKNFWKKILNKLHPDEEEEQSAPEDFEILFGSDNEMKTELGKKLKADFEEIVEKLKDIIENGKAYRDDLVQKAKEIRDILKQMGMDISNHAKQVLKNLKRKAKDFWKKILNKIHPDDDEKESSPEDFEILFSSDNDLKTELGKKLKADFEEIVEKLKDIIENGKTYKEELVQKAKEIRDILKQMGMDISQHAKQVLKNLKRKAKDFWKKILNKLHPDEDEQAPEDFEILYTSDNDLKTELGKKLSADFEEIVNKLKDIIENGKAYKEELVVKAKEIRDILKQLGMDITKHAKEVLKNLKSKAKDFWKKILNKLHPDDDEKKFL